MPKTTTGEERKQPLGLGVKKGLKNVKGGPTRNWPTTGGVGERLALQKAGRVSCLQPRQGGQPDTVSSWPACRVA